MRFLILSDSPNITTGYGVIARGLGKYLSRRGHEVVFGSLQQIGSPMKIDIDGKLFDVYSCYVGHQSYLEKTLKESQPDILIHIRDPVVLCQTLFQPHYRLKPLCLQKNVKVVHWAPLMGEPPIEVVSSLSEDSDLLLCPTEWSYNLYLFSGFPSNRMETLRWGVDTEIYKKLDNKPKKGDFGFNDDRYVVASIHVHDRIHKAAPILMKAVSLLSSRYDVELYLHTSSGAFKLDHYARILGLKNRLVMPRIYLKDWGESFEIMNELYNVVDVVASTSTMEGANMVICEALACGTPVVASDLEPHREVTRGLALYSPIHAEMPDTLSFMKVTTAESVAEKISMVFEGWRPREEELEEYRRWISWESVVKDLEEILTRHKMLK